jgi:16S rRNA (guanine1516-N2)-methyltransferase
MEKGFKVILASSIEYLKQLSSAKSANVPDIIYLDPMYPERKKSASVKKNMQLLQQLLGKDEDTSELLEVALLTARKRVVVKRPKSANPVTDKKPTYQVSSKNTRYDIYVNSRL